MKLYPQSLMISLCPNIEGCNAGCRYPIPYVSITKRALALITIHTISNHTKSIMKTSRTNFQEYHREVIQALTAIGNPALGKAIQQDRGSQLKHLGIRFPELRRRVRQGFSFYKLPEAQVLEVWDALWQTSPYGDVLFAALEFYAPIVRKRVSPGLWSVVCQWHNRIDNWCHSDGLSALYSRIWKATRQKCIRNSFHGIAPKMNGCGAYPLSA